MLNKGTYVIGILCFGVINVVNKKILSTFPHTSFGCLLSVVALTTTQNKRCILPQATSHYVTWCIACMLFREACGR